MHLPYVEHCRDLSPDRGECPGAIFCHAIRIITYRSAQIQRSPWLRTHPAVAGENRRVNTCAIQRIKCVELHPIHNMRIHSITVIERLFSDLSDNSNFLNQQATGFKHGLFNQRISIPGGHKAEKKSGYGPQEGCAFPDWHPRR